MRYTEKFILVTAVSAGVGVITTRNYQSSIYDPLADIGGHQPLWHDQWQNCYNKYRVHGMKYRLSLTNIGTTNPAWIAIMHYPYGYTPSASLETEMERRYCKKKMFMTALGQQGSRMFTKGYLGVASNNGLSKIDFKTEEAYEASFGANPAKMSTLSIVTEGYSASTNIAGIMTVTYYVELFDRKEVSGS